MSFQIFNVPLSESKIITLEEFYNSMQSQKYRKHYERLITRAQNRVLEGYGEKHHVIPKCLGGLDENLNYAYLTPEEHYVAHQILCKLYPKNNKLLYAAHIMSTSKTNRRFNNKMYKWIRERVSKDRKGVPKTLDHVEKMRSCQLGKKCSEVTRLKMSIAKKGRVVSEETRIKTKNTMTGRIYDEERRKNIREGVIKGMTSEVKAMMSANKLGKKRGPYKTKNKLEGFINIEWDGVLL